MKTLLVICALMQTTSPQDPTTLPTPAAAPDEVVPEEAAEEVPTAERSDYDGSFAEGMADVKRLASEQEFDAAFEITEALLAPSLLASWRASLEELTGGFSEHFAQTLEAPFVWLGMERLGSADRAEVRYAQGLLHVVSGVPEAADESFELARVLAGPGQTRLDAVYNLGNIDFHVGEVLRAKIPEIAGTQSQTQQVPPQPGAAPEEEPDPLPLARAAYTAAKDHFSERLRQDWRDADCRANVELVWKRLRELDEIERQREEEEQQQQDQQQQDQEQNQENEDEQQQENQDQESEGSEDQKDQEQSEDEQQQEGEEEDSEEESDEEQEPQEEEASEEDEQQEGEPREAPPEEKVLTQEEVQRLLEKMKELDEQGEEIRARIKGARRVPVKRDW